MVSSLATNLICIQLFFICIDSLICDIADGVIGTTDMYIDNTDSLESTKDIVGGIPTLTDTSHLVWCPKLQWSFSIWKTGLLNIFFSILLIYISFYSILNTFIALIFHNWNSKALQTKSMFKSQKSRYGRSQHQKMETKETKKLWRISFCKQMNF
jgi:hypothetical protein